jgi:hypothetical protein
MSARPATIINAALFLVHGYAASQTESLLACCFVITAPDYDIRGQAPVLESVTIFIDLRRAFCYEWNIQGQG